MRISFKKLKEAVHEVAETLATSLDKTFTLSAMGHTFDQFNFTLTERGVDDGMEITLSISTDDLDRFFRETP